MKAPPRKRYLATFCLSALMLGLMIVQVYFAGLVAFGAAGPQLHAGLGWGIIAASLLLLIIAATTRSGPLVWRAAVLMLLLVLQPVLAFAPRARFPELSAVHAVNALMLILLTMSVAARALGALRQPVDVTGARRVGTPPA